jgi:hypothetical protein
MLTIKYVPLSLFAEAAPPDMPGHSGAPRRYGRVRAYLVGPEPDSQQLIKLLHVRGCIDRLEWSRAVDLPENGLHVLPDPGEVLHYLERGRPLS